MKFNKKLVAPIISVCALLGLGVGSTFALFTDEKDVDISVTAGVVDVDANILNLKAYSGEWDDSEGDYVDHEVPVTDNAATFTNGGTVRLQGASLALDRISPMDKTTFDLKIENHSNIDAKYRILTSLTGDLDLFAALDVKFDGAKWNGISSFATWEPMAIDFSKTIQVEVSLPDSETVNDVQGKSVSIEFAVQAIQGNAHVESAPEGQIGLYNANDLRLYALCANKGQFDGQTAILMDDIDLENLEWPMIEGYGHELTFDGNGHTISNLFVPGGHNSGFFATGKGCTVKNVTFDGATVKSIGRAGVAVGHGICVKVENVTVKNSNVTSNVFNNDDGDKAGAVVGYLSGEPTAYVKGCVVEGCVIEGYRDVGGLVGYAGGTYEVSGNSVKNCVVKNNRLFNYKDYATDAEFHVNELIGEQGASGTVSGNTVDNVTLEILYSVNTPDMLVKFSQESLTNNFAGKTIYFGSDIDMSGVDGFTPIGYNSGVSCTIDGQGHTISNLIIMNVENINGNAFINSLKGGTVKNLTIDSFYVANAIEGKGNMTAILVGYAYGHCTFDNVHIINSEVRGYGKVSAFVSFGANSSGVRPQTHDICDFKNCSVENTKLVGTYNVAPFCALGNVCNFDNCSQDNVTWEYSIRSTAADYVQLTGVAKGQQTHSDFNLNSATYWVYGTSYYAGYANWWIYQEDMDFTLSGSPVVLDGICINTLA